MTERKRRVMVVMPLASLDGSRSYGGVDTVCQAHLQGLIHHGAGCDYTVLGFNPANDTEENGSPRRLAENVTLYWFDLGHRFGAKQIVPKVVRHEALVRRMVKQFKPDIVHTHSPQWCIWRHRGVRKMLTLHSYKEIGMTRVNFLSDYLHNGIIHPRAVSSSDIITTVSKEIQALVEKDYGKSASYVPNSIDPAFGREPRTPPPPDKIRLLLLANIAPQKRVCDALHVVSSLRQWRPNVELLVAGGYDPGSPYYKSLTQYIADNGAASYVRFLGCLTRDELLHWIKQAHIGLSLSECETFGLAPLELLQAGLPLVATRVGVFDWHEKDFSERGVRVVSPGDVNGAVVAVKELIAQGNFSADGGSAAFIRQTFTVESIMRRYVELYLS